MGNKSHIGYSIRILDNNIWEEYKKTNPSNKVKFDNREEFKKVVKEIFKVISEQILEKKAGVLIRGLGYFFIWKIPRKIKYGLYKRGESIDYKYNHYTDMYMYSPTFLPAKSLEGWSFDTSFNHNIKKGLKKNLLNRIVYKMFPFSFKSILNNE